MAFENRFSNHRLCLSLRKGWSEFPSETEDKRPLTRHTKGRVIDMKFPYVRSFAVLITVMITVLSLFSCGEDEPPTGGTSGGVIFSHDAEPTLIFGDGISTEMRNTVYSGYKSAFGVNPYFASPSSPAVEHEIIFGVTDRPASRKAYRKLRALRSDDGYTVSYVIYATGTSVAVAFDEDAVGLNERIAVEYFLNNYLFGKSELRLTPGVVYSATYSTLEYAERTDAEYKEKAWAALSAAIGEGAILALRPRDGSLARQPIRAAQLLLR